MVGKAKALKKPDGAAPSGSGIELAAHRKRTERVIAHLEKLTPDLRLAHQASGLRRTLLRLTSEPPGRHSERLLLKTLAQSERLLIRAARQKMRRNPTRKP